MSINASNEFNINGVQSVSGKFSTLRKWSKNRFSLNPKNNETRKTEVVSNIGTFKRSLSNAKEISPSKNWTQTLGRPNFRKPALGQIGKNFSDGKVNNERTNVSKNPHPQENVSFIKTIKRSMSIRLVNLKKPEEINKYLEKAKKSFLDSEYKESKKLFENLLESKHLDTLEKKAEVSLYLTAIYLLEKDVSKAEEHSKGVKSSFLAIVMLAHVKHLQSPSKDSPFSNADCYAIENGSEDEQIITNRLFESFGKKTSIQNIQ